jgi:hypothetical protein
VTPKPFHPHLKDPGFVAVTCQHRTSAQAHWEKPWHRIFLFQIPFLHRAPPGAFKNLDSYQCDPASNPIQS